MLQVAESEFLSTSLDEAQAVDKTAFVAAHAYTIDELWRRKSHFLGLKQVCAG